MLNKRYTAVFLQTAGIILITMLTLLLGQMLAFRSTMYAYNDMQQYNMAHALKNIAQAEKITAQQSIKFNQGEVKRTKDSYQVKLKSGRSFTFALSKKD